MERETGSLQLLAPLLLTGGKGADLVICGNVVLNSLNGKRKNSKGRRLTYQGRSASPTKGDTPPPEHSTSGRPAYWPLASAGSGLSSPCDDATQFEQMA
jgi:hypothetical protein